MPDQQALVDLGGVRKPVDIALVPEARVDDYVVVHVGHAIGLIDPEEAARTLALFAEMDAVSGATSAAMSAANSDPQMTAPAGDRA